MGIDKAQGTSNLIELTLQVMCPLVLAWAMYYEKNIVIGLFSCVSLK
jgi:hypothetical protein